MKIQITWLKTFSVWFLIIPVYLFFFTWVKPVIAIPVILLLLISQWLYYKEVKADERQLELPAWQFLLLTFLCFWWVSFSGVGGFGLVLHDHHKTYSIARDVIDQEMPVSYLVNGKTYYLASYIAYYLIAPLIGGIFGYSLSTVVLFVYSSLGVLLAMLWFTLLSRKNALLALLFFVCIGGLDLAGHLFQNGFSLGIKKLFDGEWLMLYWSNSLDSQKFLLYHGNTNLLFWAAPHAITSWMLSGLFFYDLLERKQLSNSPLYLFTAVFWSPFILVGIFPYFLFQLFKEGLKPYLRVGNWLLLPAFLLLVWFVNSVGVGDLQKGLAFLPFEGIKPLMKDLFQIGWFILFEVGLWIIMAYLCERKNWGAHQKTIFFILTAVLCSIPLYRLGKYNDWVQRVSLPSLFLLWVFVLQAIPSIKAGIRFWLITVFILICSFDSIAWIYQSVRFNGFTFGHHPLPYDQVRTMPEASLENDWPLEQVLAPANASFFKYIAKKKPSLEDQAIENNSR